MTGTKGAKQMCHSDPLPAVGSRWSQPDKSQVFGFYPAGTGGKSQPLSCKELTLIL